jgi:thiamine pyrophosphokinase
VIKDSYDALIVANGSPPAKKILAKMSARSEHLIAVDGGLKAFRRHQITPDFLIGDMDSVSTEDLAWMRRKKTRILPRRNQNATDLEKALAYCRLRKWKQIAILAINGNRPDHYLNGLDLAFKFRGMSIHYLIDGMLLIPLSGSKSLRFELKESHTVSWMGFPKACGCELLNAKWPIHNRNLLTGGFQSVSNRTIGPVSVKQASGRSIIMISLKPEKK